MLVRVLGTVQVVRDNGAAVTSPAKPGCVLVALALNRGQPVAPDHLVDWVWGADPPGGARDTLYQYISRLRAHGLDVRKTGAGYLLDLPADQIDLYHARSLAAQARDLGGAGDLGAAAARYRQALELWRGVPLSGLGGDWASGIRVTLERERLTLLGELFEVELDRRRHAEVVVELSEVVAAHPLAERLAGQLMRALVRCGRASEALECFATIREQIRTELGADPDPSLSDLHQRILRQDPTLSMGAEAVAPPTPSVSVQPQPRRAPSRQLPGDIGAFVGREAELADLDKAMWAAPRAVVISAVSGTAGVGKTALAVRWAHQVADRFPDGQLYVNLRGYDLAEPVGAGAALAGFLRALGIEPADIPSTVDERSALYRSELAGRRMLVLLDNANSAEQVRPLLPGGPGCLVLVTSRDDLAGLVARDGAHRLTLERLAESEALELLRRVLGAERVAAEPEAAAHLVRLCAGLPLALRVAAERAARHPAVSLTGLTAELDDRAGRLAALDIPGDPASAVQTVFSWSYRALPRDAARMFRLLGLHPEGDFSGYAAAALADADPAAARHLLELLAGAHLIERQGTDRYQIHDLLRLYAHQLARSKEDGRVVAAARRRLARWYLGMAYRAADLLSPRMMRLPHDGADVEVDGPGMGEQAEGLAWLEAERNNLVAVAGQAAVAGTARDRRPAWQLADTLRGFFWLRKYHDDWVAAMTAGLGAAELDHDLQAQAAMHNGLASARLSLSQYDPAIEHLHRAHDLARRVGWAEAEAAALGNLGTVYRHRGELDRAAEHHEQALAVFRRIGARMREAESLGNLGNVYFESGRLALAARHCGQALAIHEEAGSRYGAAIDLGLLGLIHFELGDLGEAKAYEERAMAIHRDMGAREMEGAILAELAEMTCATGDYRGAEDGARKALQIAGETQSRGTEVDAHLVLAAVSLWQGHLDRAIEHGSHALDIAQQDGYRRGEVAARIELSRAQTVQGRPAAAADSAVRAANAARHAGYRVMHGRALTALAAARLAEHDLAAAAAAGEEALAIHVDTGHRLGEARTLALLADIYQGTDRADSHRQRASRLLASMGVTPPA